MVSAPFGIQSGALNENIAITINLIGFDGNNPGNYFDTNLFLFMGITETSPNIGEYGFNDSYQLNPGKYAFLRIPINAGFLNLLNSMNLDTSGIGFAYYKNGAYDQNSISFRNTGEFIDCRLTHFSKFGGGRHSALPVELTEFTAYLNDSKVRLFWRTETEVNSYGFDVELTGFFEDGFNGQMFD